jgi:hypothetical protein
VKVGGGLNYVTGPMGSGKSLYAVRRIVPFLMGGQYVVTNVRLTPGWSARVGRHFAPHSKRRALAIAYAIERRYVYEGDLREAIRYRLPGKGESRGLFIWDEGHNDLNNRNWKERRDAHSTKSGTDALLEWATQLRKLGYVGFLLSQHMDNTDAALRRVCNFQVRLQNQREQTRLLGLRVTPWPLFLALWYPANLGLTGRVIPPMKVERYFLSWHRRLYDTHDLYHGLSVDQEDDEHAIMLPPEGRQLDAIEGVATRRGAAPKALPAARSTS